MRVATAGRSVLDASHVVLGVGDQDGGVLVPPSAPLHGADGAPSDLVTSAPSGMADYATRA
jgi:hypothetical protein